MRSLNIVNIACIYAVTYLSFVATQLYAKVSMHTETANSE